MSNGPTPIDPNGTGDSGAPRDAQPMQPVNMRTVVIQAPALPNLLGEVIQKHTPLRELVMGELGIHKVPEGVRFLVGGILVHVEDVNTEERVGKRVQVYPGSAMPPTPPDEKG